MASCACGTVRALPYLTAALFSIQQCCHARQGMLPSIRTGCPACSIICGLQPGHMYCCCAYTQISTCFYHVCVPCIHQIAQTLVVAPGHVHSPSLHCYRQWATDQQHKGPHQGHQCSLHPALSTGPPGPVSCQGPHHSPVVSPSHASLIIRGGAAASKLPGSVQGAYRRCGGCCSKPKRECLLQWLLGWQCACMAHR